MLIIHPQGLITLGFYFGMFLLAAWQLARQFES